MKLFKNLLFAIPTVPNRYNPMKSILTDGTGYITTYTLPIPSIPIKSIFDAVWMGGFWYALAKKLTHKKNDLYQLQALINVACRDLVQLVEKNHVFFSTEFCVKNLIKSMVVFLEILKKGEIGSKSVLAIPTFGGHL